MKPWCAIEGCKGEAVVGDLCIRCNDDWMRSDEKSHADFAEQLARESFVKRKSTARRVTEGLNAMVNALRPATVARHG